MKNLNEYLERVWNEKEPEKKRELAREMVKVSHGKAITKKKYLLYLERLSHEKIDSFCANYMLSGEGMKVI